MGEVIGELVPEYHGYGPPLNFTQEGTRPSSQWIVELHMPARRRASAVSSRANKLLPILLYAAQFTTDVKLQLNGARITVDPRRGGWKLQTLTVP